MSYSTYLSTVYCNSKKHNFTLMCMDWLKHGYVFFACTLSTISFVHVPGDSSLGLALRWFLYSCSQEIYSTISAKLVIFSCMLNLESCIISLGTDRMLFPNDPPEWSLRLAEGFPQIYAPITATSRRPYHEFMVQSRDGHSSIVTATLEHRNSMCSKLMWQWR